MARHAAFLLFLRERTALNIYGSVRKTKRAKHRRAPAPDPARVPICGTANAARTTVGEAKGSRRASRDQKGCATTFQGAIAARTGTRRITFLRNNYCSRFAVRSAPNLCKAPPIGPAATGESTLCFAALAFNTTVAPDEISRSLHCSHIARNRHHTCPAATSTEPRCF